MTAVSQCLSFTTVGVDNIFFTIFIIFNANSVEDHALIWDKVNFGLDYGGLWDTVFINAILQRSFLRRKSDNNFSRLLVFFNVISQTYIYVFI